jgi:hypothetical protein
MLRAMAKESPSSKLLLAVPELLLPIENDATFSPLKLFGAQKAA